MLKYRQIKSLHKEGAVAQDRVERSPLNYNRPQAAENIIIQNFLLLIQRLKILIKKAQAVLTMLQAGQEPFGGMPTCDRRTLTTGLIQPDGTPRLYFRSLHIGATAWAVLAERVNPFWLGND